MFYQKFEQLAKKMYNFETKYFINFPKVIISQPDFQERDYDLEFSSEFSLFSW